MKRKLRIGVIFGGRSGEHEVSLVSASSVIKALDKNKYQILPIGITKEGRWLTSGNPLKTLKAKRSKELKSDAVIAPDATKKSLVPLKTSGKKSTLTKLDVVFPILHGPYGEDGTVQGLLELANLPYVGADVLGSAVAMDKVIQKQVCQQVGIPTVKYIYFKKPFFKKNKSKILNNIKKLGYPVFVKPANLGSSLGITKVKYAQEIELAIKYATQFDNKIIVEKAVINPKEIEVAVLGNDHPKASVPGEIISSNEFYDYNAKYVDGQSQTVIPAKLPKSVIAKIQKIAIEAFKAVNCSGMARVDFLVTSRNKIYLTEINTIPGFTSISMYPKLWKASGLPYHKLLDKLINLAMEKYSGKLSLLTSYRPKSKWYQ